MKPANPVLDNATSCSSCFLQDHTLRHIDFDTALDRGFVYGEGSIKIQMDDLILCENCISEAAKLIGLVEEGREAARVRELEAEKEALIRERNKAQEYSDRLEGAFDARPERIRVDHRKKPRQRQKAETDG